MYDHLKAVIKERVQAQYDTLVTVRRHLHQYPELSFKEDKTALFIAEHLQYEGIELQEGIANTGLVATIRGNNPDSATVALRADMDALPITEKNDVPYRSQNKGVMHACGHDVHMASLIGVAKVLSSLRDQFDGTIKLLFQPAEEQNPGGALSMIREGALSNPTPQCILGQHVNPAIPVGNVAFVRGTMLASSDEIRMTVRGKGGHASAPHLAVDPILITSHIIIALQQIVSRKSNPANPAVLSICHVEGGHTMNVIPDEVFVEGTLRAVDEAWRSEMHSHIRDIAQSVARGMGGECDVTISRGYPCLNNDLALTERSIEAARSFLGPERVLIHDLNMWAEDFAYYAQLMPACFYYLGVSNEDRGISSSIHTPTFDVDEHALLVGPGLMSWLALQELARQA